MQLILQLSVENIEYLFKGVRAKVATSIRQAVDYVAASASNFDSF